MPRIVKCAPGELEQVPPHKSLLRCEPDKGLPIGNLNSQFFANVYLNGLDQFVKHQLRCRHYLRYCDDFSVLVVRQGEQDWAGIRERAIAWRMVPVVGPFLVTRLQPRHPCVEAPASRPEVLAAGTHDS